jgi:hypothetical protein
MKKKIFYQTLSMVMALLFVGVTGAVAQTVHIYDAGSDPGQIKVGNAGDECAQLGILLNTEFVYAYKFNEDGDEGAPNETETAEFFDPDTGDLVHSNMITIVNSDGEMFDWSATNSIGAVMVKAGTGYNVYHYDPQAMTGSGLIAYEGRGVSHVTFCWNPDQTAAAEWCSPGYWRQDHHLDSWPTQISTQDSFVELISPVTLSKQGIRAGATENPTLLFVLQSPQYYGGDAFNAVGDLLSTAHPDVNFNGERIEDSCPLN